MQHYKSTVYSDLYSLYLLTDGAFKLITSFTVCLLQFEKSDFGYKNLILV